jgi:hypothetical protein
MMAPCGVILASSVVRHRHELIVNLAKFKIAIKRSPKDLKSNLLCRRLIWPVISSWKLLSIGRYDNASVDL